MWHVGVTAPPGTEDYSATFEVYVVNTTTGQEVPGSGSGPFVLHWTSIPDGRPQLQISALAAPASIVVTWPVTATNWSLVCSSNLVSGPWVPLDPENVVSSEPSAVQVKRAAEQQFYRLQRNP